MTKKATFGDVWRETEQGSDHMIIAPAEYGYWAIRLRGGIMPPGYIQDYWAMRDIGLSSSHWTVIKEGTDDDED